MNLPNKLTVSRFVLTIAFLVVMFSKVPYHQTIALVLFSILLMLSMIVAGTWAGLALFAPPDAPWPTARQTAPLYSFGWSQGSAGFAGATPELFVDSIFPVEEPAPVGGIKLDGGLQLAAFKPTITSENAGQSAYDVIMSSADDQVLTDPYFDGGTKV